MNTISLEKPKNFIHWLHVYQLYLAAFPKAERKPFSVITKMYRKGKMDVWCIRQKGVFTGLVITINSEDLILIDYLAVCKKHRGKGIGTHTLQALQSQYHGKRLFLEIESVFEPCNNLPQRQKRKQFYLNCGLTPMEVMVYLFGVKMELLGFNCKIDYDTYFSFYRDNLGQWVCKHIAPAEYPQTK